MLTLEQILNGKKSFSTCPTTRSTLTLTVIIHPLKPIQHPAHYNYPTFPPMAQLSPAIWGEASSGQSADLKNRTTAYSLLASPNLCNHQLYSLFSFSIFGCFLCSILYCQNLAVNACWNNSNRKPLGSVCLPEHQRLPPRVKVYICFAQIPSQALPRP